jgi:hypothetical protein
MLISALAVDEFITKSSPITDKIPIYLPIVPVSNSPDTSITLTNNNITTYTAMVAD